MTISNIEKKFDEKFEGIYYGKDINGLPNYPPESFKDDIRIFYREQIKKLKKEIRKEVKNKIKKQITDIIYTGSKKKQLIKNPKLFMNTLFQEKPQVVKSIQNSDRDVLVAVRQLYLNNGNFDLDPCYSTGKFYEDLERPFHKLDKIPQDDEVIQNDIMNGLPYSANTMKSIVFDPPFMFGTHGQTKNNIMTKRFTMFDSWAELENMYKKSLSEFYRILVKGGIVAFKCQDYTDNRTTLTHCFVHNWALEQGFKVEDLFIMAFKGGRVWNSNLTQKHARKYHSYWLVLKK